MTVSCTTNEILVVQESSSTIPIDEAVATLNNALSVLNPQTKSGMLLVKLQKSKLSRKAMLLQDRLMKSLLMW